jgi:hypothetical protein
MKASSRRADSAPDQQPRELWKIEVNERYLRVMDLLIGLATASLVLPTLFLREVLGLKDQPIAIFLDDFSYGAIFSFLLVIALGVAFHYVSAKWVKAAWGQPVKFISGRLEQVMDVMFWLTVVAFMAGLLLFGMFVLRS